MSNVLEVENLTKKFRNKKVVDNITFDVREGEIFGLVGTTGSSKTTILKLITGLLRISEGNVYINGLDITENYEEVMQTVKCVIEAPDLYDYLTGRENLTILTNTYDNYDEEENIKIIRKLKLDNIIDDKVSTYSLSMKQRLGFAQALATNPRLLILDDILNGLNQEEIRETQNILKMLADEGTSILITSSSLAEVENLCDRYLIIDEGEIFELRDLNEQSIEDKEATYILDTVNNEHAALKIKELGYKFTYKKGKIFICTYKEDIIRINKELVLMNIGVFEITEHKETLEEVFMKNTETKEEIMKIIVEDSDKKKVVEEIEEIEEIEETKNIEEKINIADLDIKERIAYNKKNGGRRRNAK